MNITPINKHYDSYVYIWFVEIIPRDTEQNIVFPSHYRMNFIKK